MKNKTLATWLTLVFGPLGFHRFYLYGWSDVIGWLLPVPTAMGIYGFERVTEYGLDDVLSWWLLPIFGVALAGICLNAIVYGLMRPAQWNATFNPSASAEHPAGQSNWLTVGAVIIALMVGTVALLSALAYGIQRYFESTIGV